MKKTSVAVVTGALVLVLALVAWTDSQPSTQAPRLVTVTGDAEVRVIPDEVILTLGVETWDKNLEVAKSQNDRIVANVLSLATEHGIEPQHVQTDYVSIEPRYRNGYYEERDFIGYFVRKTIVVTLRDLSLFENMLSDALQAGVNYVHGIEFRTTELRAHRDEARALAIKAAQEKATALAGELGQSVGDPQAIQEIHSGWWSGYNSWWGTYWGNNMSQNVIQEAGVVAAMTDNSIAPGQIRVSAKVSVSFALQK
jgi:uncharacterized protein YggE